jgi:DNA-binding transcriptional LysR family regulator
MENNANAIEEMVISSEKMDPAGAVRIASMEGIGSMYLTSCISDFNASYPSIQVELITDTPLLDLNRRQADIFVSFFRPRGKGLLVTRAGEFRIFLYASTEYLKRHRAPEDLKGLNSHRFVDFIDERIVLGENRWLSDILRPTNVVFRSTSLLSQYMAASSGFGVAMLPSFVASRNADLHPILPKYFSVRDIWLSVNEDMLHIDRIRAALNFLEKRILDDHDYLVRPG